MVSGGNFSHAVLEVHHFSLGGHQVPPPYLRSSLWLPTWLMEHCVSWGETFIELASFGLFTRERWLFSAVLAQPC